MAPPSGLEPRCIHRLSKLSIQMEQRQRISSAQQIGKPGNGSGDAGRTRTHTGPWRASCNREQKKSGKACASQAAAEVSLPVEHTHIHDPSPPAHVFFNKFTLGATAVSLPFVLFSSAPIHFCSPPSLGIRVVKWPLFS